MVRRAERGSWRQLIVVPTRAHPHRGHQAPIRNGGRILRTCQITFVVEGRLNSRSVTGLMGVRTCPRAQFPIKIIIIANIVHRCRMVVPHHLLCRTIRMTAATIAALLPHMATNRHLFTVAEVTTTITTTTTMATTITILNTTKFTTMPVGHYSQVVLMDNINNINTSSLPNRLGVVGSRCR